MIYKKTTPVACGGTGSSVKRYENGSHPIRSIDLERKTVLNVAIYELGVLGSLVVQTNTSYMPAAFLYSSSVKRNASEESSSLTGDNLGHLGFVGLSPRPFTGSWCAAWLALTRQGGFGAIGSLEIFLIV